jgi:hypothetical protein
MVLHRDGLFPMQCLGLPINIAGLGRESAAYPPIAAVPGGWWQRQSSAKSYH